MSDLESLLSEEEYEYVTSKSNWWGLWLFLVNWSIVVATFVFVAVWTNPLTIVLAILLLGARHLGFGVLVHECGHRVLFESNGLNEFCGKWFAAPPVMSNVRAYMRGHVEHHRLAGTEEDPDLINYAKYPIPRSSLKRKIWRDITGQTGWKQMKSIGRGLRYINKLKPQMRQSLIFGVGFNLLLLTGLASIGYAWLYLLWFIAFFTANPLVSRIRQIAEHGGVPNLFDLDPRNNTRTIRASWLERLLICPHGVNYHLEHHLSSRVPIYRLKKMHELLSANSYYKYTHFPNSYMQLIREVTVPG